MNAKITVAIVPCNTLGDGLLYMLLAKNLHDQGYQVTVFSHLISQLSSWFPGQVLLPLPDTAQALDAFDCVIADGQSFLTQCPAEDYPKLAEKYIFMKMDVFDQRLIANHQALFSQKYQGAQLQDCLLLDKLSGVVVTLQNRKATMVDNIASVCQDVLNFRTTTKENGLLPPAGLVFKKYPKRIVIHPESGDVVKNWHAKGFIALAHALKAKGYTPAFITSPKEREKWQRLLGGAFELPLFASLSDAAAYIYESGKMVGNDSGIGHLASNLGIPTYIIHRKKDPQYRWRPGFAPSQLIMPIVSLKRIGYKFWPYFIRVNKIINIMEA